MSNAGSKNTLREILAQGADRSTALIAPETESRWSYAGLRSQVADLAAQLAGMNVGRGDRVAIVLPNGPEIVAAFLAVVHGGSVAAPLNPAYTADEFTFFFGDIEPRALIVPPGGAPAARATAPSGCSIVEAAVDERGRLTFAGGGLGAGAVAEPEPEDVALVLHTSGTTSRPKQVPLTHRNLLASARTIVQTYGLGPSDVSLCVMPLFHVHGLVASTLSALHSGGAVIAPVRFSAGRFWLDAGHYGATWYSAVPTIHQILLARSAEDGPSAGATGLRFARSCSAALAPAVMRGLEERFGMPVLEAYGMTEASHQMASNPLPPALRVPGSVGLATGVQIAIMDATGKLLPSGAVGEVVIKGESVTSAYHNNPEANAAAFAAGWFRTGDQGVLDEAGYLRLTGRLKEMILRGGENIAPREIDEVLLDHPAVAEAVAFAVPDEKYGEEVAAAVVLRRPPHPRRSSPTVAGDWRPSKCPRPSSSPSRSRAPRAVRFSAAWSRRLSSPHEWRTAAARRGGRRRRHRGLRRRVSRTRGERRGIGCARSSSVCDAGTWRARASPRGDFEAHPRATDDLEAVRGAMWSCSRSRPTAYPLSRPASVLDPENTKVLSWMRAGTGCAPGRCEREFHRRHGDNRSDPGRSRNTATAVENTAEDTRRTGHCCDQSYCAGTVWCVYRRSGVTGHLQRFHNCYSQACNRRVAFSSRKSHPARRWQGHLNCGTALFPPLRSTEFIDRA